MIHKSWARSERYGIHPHKRIEDILEPTGLRMAREQFEDLLYDIVPVTEKLYSLVRSGGSTVIVSNPDGYILSSTGDPVFLQDAERVFLKEGAGWSERSRGTNAIGLAITEQVPTIVLGDEHYCVANHILFCAATPIFDMHGNLLGALDVSGYRSAYQSSIVHVVDAIARQFEDWLVVKNKDSQIVIELREKSGQKARALIALDLDGRIVGFNRDGHRLMEIRKSGDGLGHNRLDFHSVLTSCLLNSRTESRKVVCLPSPGADGEIHEWTMSILLDKRATRVAVENHVAKKITDRSIRENVPMLKDSSAIFCQDEKLQAALDLANRAAMTDLTVLITGESGTGKELVARYIHQSSKRNNGPFVAVNCGAVAPSLLHSEMFGYEAGAFTGAAKTGRLGKFESAQNGTLFLDEIADMSFDMQTALLRTLQEQTVMRVGGNRSIAVNVRIVAATNRDLWLEVNQGRFRADLYFRLFGIQIVLPSLKERKDKLEFACQILKQLAVEFSSEPILLSSEAKEAMAVYSWPGNIRELIAVLRQAAFLAKDGLILPEHFPAYMGHITEQHISQTRDATPSSQRTSSVPLSELKDQAILDALKETDGNISKAAQLLGIGRNTVYRRLKKMG